MIGPLKLTLSTRILGKRLLDSFSALRKDLSSKVKIWKSWNPMTMMIPRLVSSTKNI